MQLIGAAVPHPISGAHMWGEWLHHPYLLGGLHVGTKSELAKPCLLGVPRGGRPLGSGRQLPPQLTVGRRPLGGGGGGGLGGGGLGGAPGRAVPGGGGGAVPGVPVGGGGVSGTSEQLGMRPCRLGDPHRYRVGGQNQNWPTCGQGGYITPAA